LPSQNVQMQQKEVHPDGNPSNSDFSRSPAGAWGGKKTRSGGGAKPVKLKKGAGKADRKGIIRIRGRDVDCNQKAGIEEGRSQAQGAVRR